MPASLDPLTVSLTAAQISFTGQNSLVKALLMDPGPTSTKETTTMLGWFNQSGTYSMFAYVEDRMTG